MRTSRHGAGHPGTRRTLPHLQGPRRRGADYQSALRIFRGRCFGRPSGCDPLPVAQTGSL